MRVYQKDKDEDYKLLHISKALGHVYRGGFDALDGAAVSLKEKINHVIGSYSSDTLTNVYPDYFEKRKCIESACAQISIRREKKDVSRDHKEAFNDYVISLESLKKIYNEFVCHASLLREHQKEIFTKNHKISTIDFLKALALLGIGGLTTYIFN